MRLLYSSKKQSHRPTEHVKPPKLCRLRRLIPTLKRRRVMMDKQDAFITDSQIQYLPSLLAKLERGEIQIPVFQRPFVWKQSQVVELLESIYRGFPIGALFFWLPGEQLSKIGNNNFLL